MTTVINSSQGQIKRDCRAHINYKWFDNVDCRDQTFYDGLKDSHWSEFCKLTSGWPLKGVKNWYGPFLKEKKYRWEDSNCFREKASFNGFIII